MPNYTGLLTGNYYFQLSTGNGFLEATNNQIIALKYPDFYWDYPHGLKRESVNNLFEGTETGFCAQFNIGADIFRIKKGSYQYTAGSITFDDTKCILWDEKNNFVVGDSDAKPTLGGDSNANSILGGVINKIGDSNCSSILGGSCNTITGSCCSSIIGGYENTIISAASSSIVGNSNRIASSCSHILGSYNCITNINDYILGNGNCITSSQGHILGDDSTITNSYNSKILGNSNHIDQSPNTVIFGFNNSSYGGNGNFVNGNNHNVCSQAGHFNATILAGGSNSVYGAINTVLGGITNRIGADANQVSEAYQNASLIGNGTFHYILGSNSTLINGNCNRVIGHNNFMGGGFSNCIDVTNYDLLNTPYVFGSIQNEIPRGNFIGNGYFNKILDTAESSLIVAGKQNLIKSGIYSSILGGFNNSIENAPNSFIIGSRSHITNLLDTAGGISGAGIISDGYAPVWNFESNKLLINFKNGILLTPGIKISSSLSMPKDGLDTVAEDIRYKGYTGISYPNAVAESIRIVNIGIGNTVHDYTDISGLSSGANGQILKGVFNRNYNPSVIVGNYNSGAHSNLLLGLRNVHHSESYEYAKAGFAKYSGIYGTGYVVDAFLNNEIKTINNGPWANGISWGWPVYQGANIMLGSLNTSTGTKNIILGNQNSLSGISNGSLVLGEGNAVLPPDTQFLLDPISSAVTGGIYGTGLWPLIRQVVSIGFRNLNLRGTDSIDFGHSNMSQTNFSQVIGRRNWTTGDFLVALGSELSSKGYRSSNIGYGNLMMGESGYYNHILGYNNIIDDYDNNSLKGTYNNQLIGNINYVRGHNNLAVGQRNIIDTLSGFSGNYTNYSIAIGGQNNA
jgi:hypothetical protein